MILCDCECIRSCYKLLLRAGIGSTSDEMHQACFKMLTTIIRVCPFAWR